MSIEETKKSLPVYPFKQDLIDAVRAHQVNILQGRMQDFLSDGGRKRLGPIPPPSILIVDLFFL